MKKTLMMLMAVVLTARLGTVTFQDHRETWYNLDMKNIVERSDKAFGMTDLYWEREDGCKMYGPWVICAADWTLHPQYSLVETSRGTGIVLDTHTAEDRSIVDLAVTW